MGGSSSKSDSDSSSQSSFDQDVWGPQGDALQNLYGQAGNLFGDTNNQMQGLMPGATNQMQGVFDQANPAYQQQLSGGATADMGLQNSLMNSLNQSMNNPSMTSEINAMTMGGEGNNYADAMKDQYVQDANRASDNMMQNLDARAAASGMSGGSRHGTATAQGMQDINQNLQRNMAETGYNTFDKDLDRKLQIAGMADQNLLANQQMMAGMIGGQDTAQQGAINAGSQMQNLGMGQFAPSMMPWQSMGAYSQALGAPTVLGSGTMSGSADANSKSASGGIGGGK